VNVVDSGENHFQTPASLAGSYGTCTFNPTKRVWGYTRLAAGQVVCDHLVISADDTACDINIKIAGTNDAAVFARQFAERLQNPLSLAILSIELAFHPGLMVRRQKACRKVRELATSRPPPRGPRARRSRRCLNLEPEHQYL
jgi:VCBS repeat-containing protein